MNIQRIVDAYRVHVEGLEANEHLDEEVYLSLTDRDSIAETWDRLSDTQKNVVEQIDSVLVSKQRLIASVLAGEEESDRKRWWWFIGKDAQIAARARGKAA